MAKPRTKADEVALKAARSADRSRLDEELRFAKRQQMAVATSAMALLGAILLIGNQLKPLYRWEKYVGMGGAVCVFLVGSYFIFQLQKHLKSIRLRIDPLDPRYLKGTPLRTRLWASRREAMVFLIFMLLVSAGIVCYVLCASPRQPPPPQIPFSLDDMLY